MIFASGRMVPAMTLINSVVKPEQRGQFMSLNSAVQQMGVGLASFVASHIVQQSSQGSLEHFGSIGYLSMVFVGLTCLLAGPLSKVANSIGARPH
jgi:predicted MFS family arabinose efflux permease